MKLLFNDHCFLSKFPFSGTTHQHRPTVSQPGGRQSDEYKCNLFFETFEKRSQNILHRTMAWKKGFCLLNSGLGSGLLILFKVNEFDNFNLILTSTFAGLECLRNTDGLGTCSILVIMVARTAVRERSPGARRRPRILRATQFNSVSYTRC